LTREKRKKHQQKSAGSFGESQTCFWEFHVVVVSHSTSGHRRQIHEGRPLIKIRLLLALALGNSARCIFRSSYRSIDSMENEGTSRNFTWQMQNALKMELFAFFSHFLSPVTMTTASSPQRITFTSFFSFVWVDELLGE